MIPDISLREILQKRPGEGGEGFLRGIQGQFLRTSQFLFRDV